MQSMVNLGLYGYYSLNKKMIADKLCINKNNPQLHCNGHCFLAKQLNKAEQNEKQQSQILKEKDEVVSSDEHQVLAFFIPHYVISKLHAAQVSPVLWHYQHDITKPPSA